MRCTMKAAIHNGFFLLTDSGRTTREEQSHSDLTAPHEAKNNLTSWHCSAIFPQASKEAALSLAPTLGPSQQLGGNFPCGKASKCSHHHSAPDSAKRSACQPDLDLFLFVCLFAAWY